VTNRIREPSLLRDVGAIAGLYVDLFRLMEKRATGHSLIVRFEPPEEEDLPNVVREEISVSQEEREEVGAGR